MRRWYAEVLSPRARARLERLEMLDEVCCCGLLLWGLLLLWSVVVVVARLERLEMLDEVCCCGLLLWGLLWWWSVVVVVCCGGGRHARRYALGPTTTAASTWQVEEWNMILDHYCVTVAVHECAPRIGAAIAAAAATIVPRSADGAPGACHVDARARSRHVDARPRGTSRALFDRLALASCHVDALFPYTIADQPKGVGVTVGVTGEMRESQQGRPRSDGALGAGREGRDASRHVDGGRRLCPRAAPRVAPTAGGRTPAAPPDGLGPLAE